MDTSGFDGKRLKEIVAVETNDPMQPIVNLTGEGSVEKFVTIEPSKIVLIGPPEKRIVGSVKIIPDSRHPFTIVGANAEKGINIKYNLEQIEENNLAAYRLTVENTMEGTGRYFDAIYLKTTSRIGPVIKILVWGNIREKK